MILIPARIGGCIRALQGISIVSPYLSISYFPGLIRNTSLGLSSVIT